MANTIFPRENGPYRVDGDIVLTDAEGNIIEPPSRPFMLCRCGQSSNKPFCDSTHKKIGFQAPAGVPPRPDPDPDPDDPSANAPAAGAPGEAKPPAEAPGSP
jgi:CDGSH-type Zn-finger protein